MGCSREGEFGGSWGGKGVAMGPTIVHDLCGAYSRALNPSLSVVLSSNHPTMVIGHVEHMLPKRTTQPDPTCNALQTGRGPQQAKATHSQ